MLARLRTALLILILPRVLYVLTTWGADALEALQDDPELRRRLDPWALAHLDEAAASMARAWDCWRYILGEGPRIEELRPYSSPTPRTR